MDSEEPREVAGHHPDANRVRSPPNPATESVDITTDAIQIQPSSSLPRTPARGESIDIASENIDLISPSQANASNATAAPSPTSAFSAQAQGQAKRPAGTTSPQLNSSSKRSKVVVAGPAGLPAVIVAHPLADSSLRRADSLDADPVRLNISVTVDLDGDEDMAATATAAAAAGHHGITSTGTRTVTESMEH